MELFLIFNLLKLERARRHARSQSFFNRLAVVSTSSMGTVKRTMMEMWTMKDWMYREYIARLNIVHSKEQSDYWNGTRSQSSTFSRMTTFRHVQEERTVLMNEMPRFFIIRKYDWFISQRTSQIQIRSKSFKNILVRFKVSQTCIYYDLIG